MDITYAPKGILQIDNARIIYRNFSGEGTRFNREGDRNFAIVIPNEDIALELKASGWNVKSKPARDEDEEPLRYLPVKVKFTSMGPNAYLETGKNLNKLNEDTISCLDNVKIACVDLDIRPYDWEVNGKTGRTAYLQNIKVTQKIDRFAAEYEDAI